MSSKQNIASLQTINNDYIEVQIFSGLNHMFQHAETGLPDEYAIIEETMAPEVFRLSPPGYLVIVNKRISLCINNELIRKYYRRLI